VKLETERLVMAPPTLDEYEESLALWSDPEVVRYIGRTQGRDEVWARLLRYAGHWALLGYGYWAVREKATGRYVGEVGFGDFRRDMQPPLKAPELGWALQRWAHGRGFATEAARAALEWGGRHFPAGVTVCIIDPGNGPSIRVAEKCGYRSVEVADFKGEKVIVFERPWGKP
jgi:RimJ/RimL family protein N-acetyltransferase